MKTSDTPTSTSRLVLSEHSASCQRRLWTRCCRYVMDQVSVLLLLVVLCCASCQPYYLSVCQEWVGPLYLASANVHTPDPALEHPPVGQMLILNWRVTPEVFQEEPRVVLDVILWDYTTQQVTFPIQHRMDVATYRLVDEEYAKSGGILTYKAQIVTAQGRVIEQWRHQLWVELITVKPD